MGSTDDDDDAGGSPDDDVDVREALRILRLANRSCNRSFSILSSKKVFNLGGNGARGLNSSEFQEQGTQKVRSKK